MKILGIETSCDDTGAAIFDSEKGILSQRLHTQLDLREKYGGVVPELSSRDHIRRLAPLVNDVLNESNCGTEDLHGVAYTAGPGLMGALLVGSMFARSLAFAWQKPSVAVHHLEAHVLAVMLEEKKPQFPFLTLLVSGGHTMLLRADDIGSYQLLGESLDDAAGEAFDKTARLMGLDYPGGARIAEFALQGNAMSYHFPRPMVDRPGLDFSFSGLKTYAHNTWQTSKQDHEARCDISHAFQEAIVDTLVIKCRRALEKTKLKQLVIAGGVAANQRLRERLAEMVEKFDAELFYPKPSLCTDNGAMVAYAGYRRFLLGQSDPLTAPIQPRWPL